MGLFIVAALGAVVAFLVVRALRNPHPRFDGMGGGKPRALALAVLLVAGAAQAACPTSSATSVTAGPNGALKVCPAEVDADGDPVGSGFYARCDVRATWVGGGSASTSVTALTPGTTFTVNFPAAKGAGSASADCTNVENVKGAAATASVTFRRGIPASPVIVP